MMHLSDRISGLGNFLKKNIGWYYDARDPSIGRYWDGTKFSQVKQLEDVGLETLYDVYTDEPIPDYDRPAAAVQHFQPWKKEELRVEALARSEASKQGVVLPPTKKRGLGCLGIIFFAVIIAMAFNSFSPTDGKKSEAQYVCEQFIKDRLSSPSSAKFGKTTVVQQDATFKVTSVVEAENALGVSLQNTWTCRVLWSPAKQTFILDLIESN